MLLGWNSDLSSFNSGALPTELSPEILNQVFLEEDFSNYLFCWHFLIRWFSCYQCRETVLWPQGIWQYSLPLSLDTNQCHPLLVVINKNVSSWVCCDDSLLSQRTQVWFPSTPSQCLTTPFTFSSQHIQCPLLTSTSIRYIHGAHNVLTDDCTPT